MVTGVRSRTHLVHVSAYLRRELRRDTRPFDVRYVGGGQFLGNAQVSDRDVHAMLPADERLAVRFVSGADRWAPAAQGALTYIAVGAPGLKPWASMRRNSIGSRIHVVVTDEGLGTYGDWRTRRMAWKRQGVREPWASVRSVAVESGARALTSERFALYRKEDAWALDPDIRAEFRRDLETGPAGAPGGESGRVVLLTQPWVVLGAISAASYLGFVGDVADALAAQGRRLQVRPHPAEDLSLYAGFDVLHDDRPAELDPRVVGADAVIGGTSTALLNLAALHGIPAARVSVPGLEQMEHELSTDQSALLDTYLPAPTGPGGLRRLWSKP